MHHLRGKYYSLAQQIIDLQALIGRGRQPHVDENDVIFIKKWILAGYGAGSYRARSGGDGATVVFYPIVINQRQAGPAYPGTQARSY